MDRTACRFGYQQVQWWVPGMKRRVKLMAHLCTWIIQEAGCVTANELYLAYQEFRASGLVLDHTCVNPPCRNPDHLEPVTRSENEQRKHARRSPRAAVDTTEAEF